MSSVGAVDVGGSHVAAAVFINGTLGQLVHRAFPPAPRSASSTLDAIASAMTEAGTARRWTVAVPGPFDYACGVSLITGLDKLDELFNVHVKGELTKRLPNLDEIEFVNDAHAAALGEWAHGAGGRANRMLFIGLGTGLGSAFIEAGGIVDTGPEVPPGGHLGLTTFSGTLADDQFSTRGLLAKTGYSNTLELTTAADSGSMSAIEGFLRFGQRVEQFLVPWCDLFAPDSIVFGGGLSNAYKYFSAGFTTSGFANRCLPAVNPDTAALYGIAALADRT